MMGAVNSSCPGNIFMMSWQKKLKNHRKKAIIIMQIKKIEEELKMPYLASWEKSAKREGKREGKKEGIKEEKLETAKRMLLNNFSVEQVITATGLTEKEIKELVN
jgi:predicted transposase/invertase (TIGR01784 family)